MNKTPISNNTPISNRRIIANLVAFFLVFLVLTMATELLVAWEIPRFIAATTTHVLPAVIGGYLLWRYKRSH